MSNRPDWNSWILKKSIEEQVDTLKKSDTVVVEDLEKARKALPFKEGSNIAFESYHDDEGKPRKNRRVVEHTTDGKEIVHDDTPVEAKHNLLAGSLNRAREHAQVHSQDDKENTTQHGPGGDIK